MLRLVKTEITPQLEQRLVRMQLDVVKLQKLTGSELQSIYCELEIIRDGFSRLLDRVDGKHV
jgi:hypothetical protein